MDHQRTEAVSPVLLRHMVGSDRSHDCTSDLQGLTGRFLGLTRLRAITQSIIA